MPSTVRPCSSTSLTQNSTTSGTRYMQKSTQVQSFHLMHTHLVVGGYWTVFERLPKSCKAGIIHSIIVLLLTLQCSLKSSQEAGATPSSPAPARLGWLRTGHPAQRLWRLGGHFCWHSSGLVLGIQLPDVQHPALLAGSIVSLQQVMTSPSMTVGVAWSSPVTSKSAPDLSANERHACVWCL